MTRPPLSEAIQDYLKGIYKLQEAGGRATVTALARDQGVSPASASAMVKKLAALDLLEHEPYQRRAPDAGGREGRARGHPPPPPARALPRARRSALHVDDVHDEADRLEHVISEELEERIDRALGYPTHDPHGDPIPDANLEWPAPKGRALRAVVTRRRWAPFSDVHPLRPSPRSSSPRSRKEEVCARAPDPRAPPRALARRHPQGRLHHEPALARAGPAPARPAGRRCTRSATTSSRAPRGSRPTARTVGLERRVPAPRSRASSTTRAPTARSHAAIPFDLKTTMSSGSRAPAHLAGDDVLELVHLEPVEHAPLHRLDQVAGLELRLLARVAAHEGGPFEHRVVELPTLGSFAPTAQTSAPVAQPVAAQHRILRGRRRDDDVGVGGLAVRLDRLAAVRRGRTPARRAALRQ